MKYLLLVLSIFYTTIVFADSDEAINTLVRQFDEAASKAESTAAKEYGLEKQSVTIVATPSPTPQSTPKKDARNTDQVIDDLMRQVESLQSRVIVTRKVALAEQQPSSAKLLGARTTYSFKEGEIYQIHGGVDRVTDIELQPGEMLSNPPIAGDTVRWKIALVKSTQQGKELTHVVIKPLDTNIETNIIITTNRRTYHLRAMASDWYMPSVAWNYPQDAELEEQTKAFIADKVEPISLTPELLNFSFEIIGDDFNWKPLRVFDDGIKTYLQMPPTMRSHEAPALFVIEDEDVLLVNYRVKGDFYVVDRLFDHAQLRVGTKRIVEIWSKAARPSLLARIF